MEMLYAVRDRLLAGSATGRKLTSLYYRHGAELSRILVSAADMQQSAAEVIEELLPVIGNMLNGRNTSVPGAVMKDVLKLMDGVSAQAGPSLKNDLQDLKKRVESGAILKEFNLSIGG
jgi:hypothetical protein